MAEFLADESVKSRLLAEQQWMEGRPAYTWARAVETARFIRRLGAGCGCRKCRWTLWNLLQVDGCCPDCPRSCDVQPFLVDFVMLYHVMLCLVHEMHEIC